ncbi:hypothetical protein LVB77_07055 [Lysobacter sp. 5GHs7-4]|uniref:hypothetical protein n=1 Tax=Lysobacter sp. 5GHs7-4 TaxID=2904253 RepID=UPI001E402DEC|nr:hypothetical protein [Lysobacter sp. 5GHs7-4]UHQ24438.1 hypothetical protein LVB77_07055 [Lysobacter sp. 5GHs7-4]
MNDSEKYEAFAKTFCEALVEMALEAKRLKEESPASDAEAFHTGYLSGFHRVFTLLAQQAEIFELPASELGLDRIDASNLI